MSVPTQKEYFHGDFDATTLRVPQLRSILLEHDVTHPSTAKKADLLALFEEYVRPKASASRAAATRVKPSNRGITMITEGDDASSTGSRRGGGRRRKVPPTTQIVNVEDDTEEEEDEVIVPASPPAKRPRGRAKKSIPLLAPPIQPELEEDIQMVEEEENIVIPQKPNRGRARSKKSISVALTEDTGAEAEIEEETIVVPQPKKRGRASKARPSVTVSPPPAEPQSSAPSSTRKPPRPSSVSQVSEMQQTPVKVPLPAVTPKTITSKRSEPSIRIMDAVKEEPQTVTKKSAGKTKTPRKFDEGEESGFSDYNPFQSGSEEAAERERRRRKSSIGLSVKKPKTPRYSEPAPAPSAITPPTSILRRVGPSRENLKTPPSDFKASKPVTFDDVNAAEEYNHSVSAKLNQITSSSRQALDDVDTQIVIRQSPAKPSTSTSLIKRVQAQAPQVVPKATIPLSLLFMMLLGFIGNWKAQSSRIGYCDTGTSINDIVMNREKSIKDAYECINEKARLNYDQPHSGDSLICDASVLPLVPLPRPSACTACPPHAKCEDGEIVACAPEYVLSPHPLAFLDPIVDGLPGLGPRPFAASCKPDTVKKRMIGHLATEIEKFLAERRGEVVCTAGEEPSKSDGIRYGVKGSEIKEMFSERRDPKFSQEQFDEVFESALKDLLSHQDIVEAIDTDDETYYAASRADMTFSCRARMEAVHLLSRWKSQLGSTMAVLAAIALLRNNLASRKQEKSQVDELVQVVLQKLRDQEYLHSTDNVITPTAFVPPDQLRDLVIPSTASYGTKQRLWRLVQEKIEGNANVAVREQEVRGELWKTWEWTGMGERRILSA